MSSTVALHIGNDSRGRYRDGDIVLVHRTYDAQRVIAETISNRRMLTSAVSEGDAFSLDLFYKSITDPNKQPQPTPADLARWWTAFEDFTGLDRADFSQFPYTSREQQFMLIVPLDREATIAERGLWTGKADAAEGVIPVPHHIDWQSDIMPFLRVRRGPSGSTAASVTDVQNRNQIIRVLDPFDPALIRRPA